MKEGMKGPSVGFVLPLTHLQNLVSFWRYGRLKTRTQVLELGPRDWSSLVCSGMSCTRHVPDTTRHHHTWPRHHQTSTDMHQTPPDMVHTPSDMHMTPTDTTRHVPDTTRHSPDTTRHNKTCSRNNQTPTDITRHISETTRHHRTWPRHQQTLTDMTIHAPPDMHASVIFDILEPSAFRKYSICWVFSILCLCLCHHYMIEHIVLIIEIFHMMGLT